MFVCAVCRPSVLQAQDDQNSQEFDERKLGDVVCGPRCVEFVLRHYNRCDDELIDLIREMQWPDFEAGSTLSGIQSALEKRNVSTHAMQIPAGARLRWDHPVILHLNGQENTLGHFVVWLPSSTIRQVQVWTGLPGVQTASASQLFSAPQSVLLTAPQPIEQPRVALVNFDTDRFWTVFTTLVCTAFVVTISTYAARRWLGRRARRDELRATGDVSGSIQKGTIRC